MEEKQESNVLAALSNQMADAVEKIGPGLVTVYGRPRQPGSGVVYGKDLVLTADHVLQRDEDLTVETHDGRKLTAVLGGRDPGSDLAVLKVKDLGLEPAPTAVQPGRVGQLILAVGRPSSSGPMASIGIVSAIGGPLRTGRGMTLDQYIRTDAIPYPGFSGGALIDAAGAVLGIISTGLAGSIALAVPAAIAWRVADSLAKTGRIKRGFIGVSSQPVRLAENVRGGRPQESGLLIVQVHDDSPAQKAGLLVGDIIVGVDGQPTTDTDDLLKLLSGERVGKPAGFEVVRGGVLQTVEVTIGERD